MEDEQRYEFYHRNLDFEQRVIYFGAWQPSEEITELGLQSWEVNDVTIQNLIKGLYILNRENSKPITVIWSSYGGDWDAGMCAFDFIKQIKSPVTIRSYGRIRSMGTVILQACEKRYISKNCLFMIHYGYASYAGIEKDFEGFNEELTRTRKIMEQIYLKSIRKKHPAYNLKKLRELMKYDKYLTPQQAVKLGLADRVM